MAARLAAPDFFLLAFQLAGIACKWQFVSMGKIPADKDPSNEPAPEKRGSAGGKARRDRLSQEERREIASRAAEVRWSRSKAIPRATHESELEIGDVRIPCAVLDDGTRILTQSGFLRALDRNPQPKSTLDETVKIVGAENLKPFIDNELLSSLRPIDFLPKKGGRALGFKAELLPQVCEAYLAARQSNALHHTQAHIAKAAEVIVRGLARVGIVALIDEATGYQYDRARNALAEILENFIAEEVRKWTKTFPLEFYKQIFRLKGWDFDPASVKRPILIAQYTNEFVYRRLAPGVLDELKRKNPPSESGRRRYKHFQWLTGDVGHPRLLAHIEGVTLLMKLSNDMNDLRSKLDEHYPIIETTELGFEIVLKK